VTDSIIYSLVIYFFVQLEQICRQQSPVLRPLIRELHARRKKTFRDRLHYLHGRNILFFQDSNSEREEDKDDTRRDIFLPRYLRAKRYVVPDVRKASFRGNEE